MKHLFENVPGLDGAHWGLSDWYPEHEKALRDAIASEGDFTTGWYASKKEIASARITRINDEVYAGDRYLVEVSVSDDMDTEGRGAMTFPAGGWQVDKVIEELSNQIGNAWDRAIDDQRDNRVYCGYSIGYADEQGRRKDWIWTYLQPVGDGHLYDEPPGDNYFNWGWEYGGLNEEADQLTDQEREDMEAWIDDDTRDTGLKQFGRWVIDTWDNT